YSVDLSTHGGSLPPAARPAGADAGQARRGPSYPYYTPFAGAAQDAGATFFLKVRLRFCAKRCRPASQTWCAAIQSATGPAMALTLPSSKGVRRPAVAHSSV